MEGTFGDDIWWGGGSDPDLGGGSGGGGGNGREPDVKGCWGQECQMAGDGGNGRGQDSQIAIAMVVGQEGDWAGGADGRGSGAGG